MKTKFSIIAIFCFVFTGLITSCSDDDDKDKTVVPPSVQKAFELQYPNAKNTNWEINNGYYVAEFNDTGYQSIDAWYNPAGEWFLSEYDVDYNDIPTVVKTTFANTAYGTWIVDDVDLIKRPSFMNLYIIEAEDPISDNDIDVYISEDGILIKTILDGDNSPAEPVIIPKEIKDFMTKKYPNASIVDFDLNTNGNYDVDFIENNKKLEAIFDNKYNWLYTDSEVLLNAVPKVVTDALNAKYAGYTIDDDVTLRTMPTPPNLYIFELEKEGMADITAVFDENGTFIE